VARGRWFSGPDARTGGAAPVTGVGLVLGSWLLVRGPWNAWRPPKRRGPQGACGGAELLRHIEAVIAALPFSGEGYRKVWAPRVQDTRSDQG
jgi:hypothetical protein